eukprot:3273538-Rhodomonas_salina.1
MASTPAWNAAACTATPHKRPLSALPTCYAIWSGCVPLLTPLAFASPPRPEPQPCFSAPATLQPPQHRPRPAAGDRMLG